MSIDLTGNDLTFDQLYAVALRNEPVSLASAAVTRMQASRAVVDRLVAANQTAYGINTGFGKLAPSASPPSKFANCKSIWSAPTPAESAHRSPSRKPAR